MSATTPVRPDPAAWHHQHTVRVYWEDTDAGGIVFYGNYLKFMERARTEWLRTIGFEQETMRKAGEGMFIVADTQLRYLRPAKLDDLLTVSVTIREIGRVSVVFEQTVWRGDTLLTQGQIRIGWVEPRAADAASQTDSDQDTFRPGRIPARILARLPAPKPVIGG